MIILVTAITLAPSLVLLAFRHYFAVAFIYASMLFWILVWRIEYPHQYYVGRKYDDPGVTLVFLGLISAAVFSVWATIRSFVFMWRVLKSNRDEPRFLIGLPGRLHGSITTCETCQRDRDRL